ncbi:hypothetical protein FACS1894217_08760 [Clostridia bacterium]|nr:hypothetical protein FACS1894217_08760 [Clostridia bacterium]
MSNLQKTAEFALEQLKKAGADGAGVSVSNGQTDEINVDAGKFSLMRTTFNSMLNVKAIVGGRKGTATTNRLDDAAIVQAAQNAVDAAKSARPDEAEGIAEDAGVHSFCDGPTEIDREKLFDRARELVDTVNCEYPKVGLEQFITDFKHVDIMYLNSNGTQASISHGGYKTSLMFSAREGDITSSFNGAGAATRDLDTPFIDLATTRTLIAESERQIHTKAVEGKFTAPVLVTPNALAELLDSIFENCLSDGAIIDKVSPWINKLQQTVADKNFTMSVNSLDNRMVFGERVTADGYISADYDVIRDGVLKSFALSRYGAKKSGFARAANTSGSVVIKAGDFSVAELTRKAGRGLLLNRFSGGAPSPNGDFSGVAKNSFLIENGIVTDAVSETMISGNLLTMLNNIIGISREIIADGVTVLPWILFDGVTISGK